MDSRACVDALCPKCKKWPLTEAKPSTGFKTPGNEGRYWRGCPANTFRDDKGCDFFEWVDELSPPPWGNAIENPRTPSKRQSCTSDHCRSAPKARAGSQRCSQKFCKECCLACTVPCSVPAHRKTAPLPTAIPLTATSVAPFAGPFARMVSSAYAEKIANKDFDISPSKRVQTEEYRLSMQHTIKVRLWASDTSRALVFQEAVPLFPYFHPKDSKMITSRLECPCATYEFLRTSAELLAVTSEDDDEWQTTSLATKVKPNMELYLRLPGVSTCVGLRPSSSHKRILSDPFVSVTDSTASSPITPSPTKRSRMQANTQSHDEDEVEFVAFIPATTPVSIPEVSPSPSRPPSGKRSQFPLAFAVDMHAAFKDAKRLQLAEKLPARELFEKMFGFLDVGEFNSSTWSDSWKTWSETPCEDMDRAIACGHKAGGEWSPLVTAWRRRKGNSC
ncbi:hypothetical protein FB45DRAFT_941835 [Roridomyces roridus]|uniref:GRF-type domain-containing protein n=1 Tax=Roridomyces roridus TaxID=1738132 RepID=A0AAD7B5Q2_9AGAR|nr:hypothetical protein FB45DRAFT_941835 [Roridomyces roridus]